MNLKKNKKIVVKLGVVERAFDTLKGGENYI